MKNEKHLYILTALPKAVVLHARRRQFHSLTKAKNVNEKTRLLIRRKASARPGSLRGVTDTAHPAWKGGYGRNKSQSSTKDYEWKKP